jgi:hypothetical protein
MFAVEKALRRLGLGGGGKKGGGVSFKRTLQGDRGANIISVTPRTNLCGPLPLHCNILLAQQGSG